MKQLFTGIVCLLLYASIPAQNNFILKGKIKRLSTAQHIQLMGPVQFIIPVAEDGSFEISGQLSAPGIALIKTDSSGADAIWLEPGEYTIGCEEIRKQGVSGILFRIPGFSGPQDASLHHHFNEPRFYMGAATPDETKKIYRDFSTRYIDSLFKNFPATSVLPDIIRSSQFHIGDEATQFYQSLLSMDQKNSADSKQLDDYFNRKAKMTKEQFFEDFTMKTEKNRSFRLSAVTGKKLILIDFWSSDCFPCRRKHEQLVKLYKKYAAKGLEIVSVSLDDTKADWLKAITKDQMNWHNVSDLKGWNTPLAERYFVRSLPFSLWLDGERKILGTTMSDADVEKFLGF